MSARFWREKQHLEMEMKMKAHIANRASSPFWQKVYFFCLIFNKMELCSLEKEPRFSERG